MPSDTSIQQSLLDTIERSFYQKLPPHSQGPEGQEAEPHPREKDPGISYASGHPYQPHPVTPERLARSKHAPSLLQSRQEQQQQQQHQQQHRLHDIFGHPASGLVFMLRWGCAILTVAATILFGVWAPLSYQATKEANKDNDEMQRALVLSAKSANEIATSALYAVSQQLEIATAQASVINNLEVQLAAVGQVALLQFCNAQTRGDFAPCSAFINSVQLTSLVSQIATPVPTVPSTTRTVTGIPQPTDSPSNPDPDLSKSPRGSGISIAAILGIVFGGTAVVGILTGCLVWRYQRGRLVDSGRYQ